ncbi:MAG: hypothetical protein CM1200mP22_33480 [Dehalococcoidia bacterium]|nr:MAG: hypothetical protein CM1200mP22_33480 [Dehalococcoidia bacterium]
MGGPKGIRHIRAGGPWIDTEVDPQNLEMIVRLNDEEVQHGKTEEMLFTFAKICQLHKPAGNSATGGFSVFWQHRCHGSAETRRPY